MNPSDANSSLATLRQLKEMLDAGTLTPQEFEALKQQLVFGKAATEPTPSAPLAETISPAPESVLPPLAEPTPPVSVPAEMPDWLVAPAPPLPADTPEPASLSDEAAERRNPLTLVFAIGGALVLLALVLYLALGSQAPDEHLTSTSQTAADSTATKPEIGPQAEQLTLKPAAPETVRVAPVAPPVAAPAASQFRTDSTAPAVSTPAAAPAATPKAAPATKPASAPTPAATPDSAAKANQP